MNERIHLMKFKNHSNATAVVTFGKHNKSNSIQNFTKNDLEKACRQKIIRPLLSTKKESLIPRIDGSKEDEDQLTSLDKSVQVCAKKYNECKSKADQLEERVKKKSDELSELQREGIALDEMIQGKNNEANVISDLKEQVQSASLSSEMKLHYRMQLNHMHVRQRNLSTNMDKVMNDMTNKLQEAEANRFKFQKMLNDLESSLIICTQTYEDFVKQVQVERSSRERKRAEKRLESSNAEKIEIWRNSKDATSKEIEEELHGSNQTDSDAMIRRIQELEEELGSQCTSDCMVQKNLESSKELILSIQKATGVNNISDLIEKFTNRQEEIKRMTKEKILAETRHDSISKALKNVQEEYRLLTAMTDNTRDSRWDSLHTIQADIEKEYIANKVLKSTKEQLDTMLVVLHQGVAGLYHRLLPFQPTLVGTEESSFEIKTILSEIEMLPAIHDILDKIGDKVGYMLDGQTYESIDQRDSISTLQNPNLFGETNCRIQSKSHKTHPIDTAEDAEDQEGDVLTRRGVKMLSVKTFPRKS